MQGLPGSDLDFSFKSFFVPLTNTKAITWIVIVGLIVYANMLFNGFVWDDKTYILINSQGHSLNISYLFGPNLFNMSGQYRPIAAIYFATLYSLFNNNSFFYHFFQLILHITNTILLFYVLKKFFQQNISFILSLIFLVHPMQVEAVSYISSSGNPLFFLFGMIALMLSLKSGQNIKRFFCIFIFLSLSLLVNEAGILFVITILFYKIIFQREKLSTFFLVESLTLILYFAIRFGIGHTYFAKPPTIPITSLSFSDRLLNIPVIFLYYLKTFFFPIYLAIDQQWIIAHISLTNFYIPLTIEMLFFLVLGILGFQIYKKKENYIKVYVFFLLWFFVGIIPYMQIFPIDGTVADRWFYFSIVGLLGILGITVQSFYKNTKNVNTILLSSFIIILLFLSIRTIIRNINWHNGITLYTHDIQISDNYDLEGNLGDEYGIFGQNYGEALKHFKIAAKLYPDENRLFNVGYMYENMGELQEAKLYYFRAMEAKNYTISGHRHNLNTYQHLGEILLVTEKPEVAKAFLLNAIMDYPTDGSLWAQLAVSEYYLHNQNDAILDIDKAKSLYPGSTTSYLYNQIKDNQPIKIEL